jgi:hypothetical protein
MAWRASNNTKLVKPWFAIVVYYTTKGFHLEGNKAQEIEKILKENDLPTNGCRVEGIAWLNRNNL